MDRSRRTGRNAIRGAIEGTLGLCLMAGAAQAASLPPGLTEQEIDDTAARARAAFDVPGLAIAIVHDGKIVFSRGYGHRARQESSGAVDSRTLFAIGSNSKEFTATALAQLVDSGKLDWNDRVIDHLPEFRVADPWITRELRVSDLLTHHSGMGLGAGDLMLFSHSTFTRAEVLSGLPFMLFTGQFRSGYAYNNLLYVVAGALIERMTGQSWEDAVQTRLIGAAGLPACQSTPPVKGQDDVARGNGASLDLPDKTALRLPAMAPAGGIWCSADGMARWAQTYLGGGVTPEGTHVFSLTSRDALWSPHALLPLPETAAMTATHFRAYGYGWFMEDFLGRKRVWHTGTVSGMVSYMSFLPELKTAIVVLTNQDDSNATYAMALTLSAYAATGHSDDWIAYFKRKGDAAKAEQAKQAATSGPGSPARPYLALPAAALEDYVGTYRDDWRGLIAVTRQGDALHLGFDRTDGKLTGTLHALPHDLFVARWDDRTRDGDDDCYVQFERDVTGKVVAMRLQLVRPDFSFDAQDLHPRRIEGSPR